MSGYIGKSQGVTQVDGYNRTEADDRYVNASGDTMTGDLLLGGARTYFGKDAANFHWLAASDIPSEPNRLAYGFGSDGSIVTNQRFFTNGLQRMEIDSAGRVTMPYQPAFAAGRNLGTVSGGSYYVFNVISTNIGGHYNASNGAFTAPLAGCYCFMFQNIVGSGNTTTYNDAQLHINGSRIAEGRSEDRQGTWSTTSISKVVYMNAGDYVQIYADTGVHYGNDQFWTFFSGYLIG